MKANITFNIFKRSFGGNGDAENQKNLMRLKKKMKVK